MLSPSPDPEVPMDYTSEYDNSDKSSMDDSDEACSIPGSFSPDNNQDGTSGDQRYEDSHKQMSKMGIIGVIGTPTLFFLLCPVLTSR